MLMSAIVQSNQIQSQQKNNLENNQNYLQMENQLAHNQPQQDDLSALLEEGFLITQEVRRLYQLLGTIKVQIVSIAEKSNPYRRKTIKLDAGKYHAVVLFKEDKSYSPIAIPAIRGLLGEAKYIKLFREKTEFKGNYQALKSFLATISSDHNEQRAKELILKAEVTTISPPYIKFTADSNNSQENIDLETGEIYDHF